MNHLIMMIGLPGSGKSTYAKMLMGVNPGCEYVSRDEVRYEYVTDQAHYFDHENDVFKEFCNRIDKFLLQDKMVIADATHLNIASRKKLLDKLQVIPDEITAIVVNTPFEICFARNAERVGITRVPDKTMYSMRNNFRPPSPREGFTNIKYLYEDSNNRR